MEVGRGDTMTEPTYGGHTAAELRALCDAATPGPWDEFHADDEWWIAQKNEDDEPVVDRHVCDTDGILPGDIEFMIAARNALPALLDRVAALEASMTQIADLLIPGEYDMDAIDDVVKIVRAALEARNDR